MWVLTGFAPARAADDTGPSEGRRPPTDPKTLANDGFRAASQAFQTNTNDYDSGWKFARACFDLAEFATNNAGRASLAESGISASRRMVRLDPARVEAHYYLGMNLGQLARTRTLGALRIVDEMEAVFLTASARDPEFDYGGPHRNLGLLYLEAPAIGSVGNRSKAHQHLRRAVELFPRYPDNRLNLAEAYLKWNEHDRAAEELKALADAWDSARDELAGPKWAASWRSWERRLAEAQQTVARENQ